MSSSDAAHEFSALNTLLFCVIVGLCILAAYLIKKNQVYYLPESAAAIFVGLIVGGLTRYEILMSVIQSSPPSFLNTSTY
jgi:sodium/hydrogen exchanger 8